MDSFTVLINRIDNLEVRCENAENRYVDAEKRCENAHALYTKANRKLKLMGSLAACALVAGVLISPGNKAIAQGYGESLHQLISDVNALKQKTQFMSVNGKTTTFTACNVQIVNGLGATDGNPNDPTNKKNEAVTNGLGNLIIGYNYSIGSPETGSHNLILGDENGYTSYGGIVDGYANEITEPYASITGGEFNLATGIGSAVSGGYGSIASGIGAAVSGGFINTAKGDESSVSGGQLNSATGSGSSVEGGSNNLASGFLSSIAAGYYNTSPGELSSCLGGNLCSSDDAFSAVLGGYKSIVDTGNQFTHFP